MLQLTVLAESGPPYPRSQSPRLSRDLPAPTITCSCRSLLKNTGESPTMIVTAIRKSAGETARAGMFKDFHHADLAAKGGRQEGTEVQCKQRMTTEFEEVVVRVHIRDPERLCEAGTYSGEMRVSPADRRQ